MMTKTRFLLVALLVLASAVCSPVFAARYNCPLDAGNWKMIGGICTYDRNTSWSYKSNGEDFEELVGTPPLQDPRIRQNVVNNTVEDIWTDWHVAITNGKNLRGIIVNKVEFDSKAWLIDPPIGGGVGFFAHVESAGPGNPMAVNPGQTLYVEFTYDVDVIGQPVSITQYPTTWWPIPEPASIMALLMGMGAFGFGAIRRMKK